MVNPAILSTASIGCSSSGGGTNEITIEATVVAMPISAVATTVTGFFFPFHGFTPAIGLGIISLPFLALTLFARYPKHISGAWRWIYVIGAVICLYFNLFVAVVQSFEKIPALHALASTQTEPPFKLTQLIVLVLSILLAIVAVIRFRPEPVRIT